jgi:tetratricopeptide (TPR) repeat protein
MKAQFSTRLLGRTLGVPIAVLTLAGAVRAQTPPGSAAPAPPSESQLAEAYHQFLLGSYLEAANDTKGAIAAYKQAMALDPTDAGPAAQLADLYLSANQTDDAIAAADKALAIDPDNVSAHQTLGFIYAAMADHASQSRSNRGPTDLSATDPTVEKAIDNLEKAIAHPVGEADADARATLARLYIRTGAFDKAVPLLSNLVAQEPDWREGPELLLQAYVGAGRTDDAIKWLETAAPDNPSLYPTLGDFYDRQHRWKDAANAYAAAMKLAPHNVGLQTRYASSLINAGGRDDLNQARSALTDALSSSPTDMGALYLLSQAQRRLGDLTSAANTAQKIISQDSTSPWGYYALAETLEERGLHKELIDALEPAVARFRAQGARGADDLQMLLPYLGFAYQDSKDYDKAIATFEEARKLDPDDPSLLDYLIQANTSAKKYSTALDLIHGAMAKKPDDLHLARLEAKALVDSGKVSDGVNVIQSLVAKNPDDPTGYLTLAEIYQDAKRDGQAATVLEQARQRFPKDTAIPFQLGAVLDKEKKYDEAEAAFRQVIALDPDHAPALNYLGYMLADRGVRLDESLGYLKHAVELDPYNGAYLDSLGWAYFKSGDLGRAETNLSRAAEQLGTNSVIQDHYGDVLDRLERYSDAIAAWTRALDGDGDSIDRKDIEKKIKTARQKLDRKK